MKTFTELIIAGVITAIVTALTLFVLFKVTGISPSEV